MFEVIKLKSGYPNHSFNIEYNGKIVFEGATMYEHEISEVFKPWQVANILMHKHNINFENININRLTLDCFCITFDGSGFEIVARGRIKTIELFNNSGNLLDSLTY